VRQRILVAWKGVEALGLTNTRIVLLFAAIGAVLLMSAEGLTREETRALSLVVVLIFFVMRIDGHRWSRSTRASVRHSLCSAQDGA
jgi:hypothetical protein